MMVARFGLPALLLLAMPGLASAQPGPSCEAVRTAFASGSYDQREAIVDALQDRLKAPQRDKALGRDGKMQAVMLALTRCETASSEAFMPMLDRAGDQVAKERARHHGD